MLYSPTDPSLPGYPKKSRNFQIRDFCGIKIQKSRDLGSRKKSHPAATSGLNNFYHLLVFIIGWCRWRLGWWPYRQGCEKCDQTVRYDAPVETTSFQSDDQKFGFSTRPRWSHGLTSRIFIFFFVKIYFTDYEILRNKRDPEIKFISAFSAFALFYRINMVWPPSSLTKPLWTKFVLLSLLIISKQRFATIIYKQSFIFWASKFKYKTWRNQLSDICDSVSQILTLNLGSLYSLNYR